MDTFTRRTIGAALSLLLVAGHASAKFLYVASLSGVLTTLNFESTDSGYSLSEVASTRDCGSSPTWLNLDSDGTLYCNDEGYATWPTGHLVSMATYEDGSLEAIGSHNTRVGGCSSQLYGSSGLAVAYYAGSSFATWDISDPANVELLTEEVFELDGPGAVPDRQEAPHPHQVIADPTGNFLFSPDLGADHVLIYAVEDLEITALDPLTVPAGTGPRHISFAVHGETTYMYLINELSNTIFGYVLTYGNGSVSLEQVWESGTHGEGVEVPNGATAAEITVTPDQNYLIISSRGENALEIPNLDDPEKGQPIVSDVLVNFSIDPSTGSLTNIQEVPSGGSFPRQFALDEDATFVAVVSQNDERVVVIERDVETGQLGEIVAHASIRGEVTFVMFNDLI